MNIQLLPIDNVDISLLQKWQNDVNIKYLTKGFIFPIQIKSVENWLESVRKQNGTKRVVYGIFLENDPVGIVSLHDIDYVNSNAKFAIYLSDPKNNNKGIGFKATSILLDFAFNAMGLQRIELEVLASNKNGIHLYKKIGFEDEGIKRSSYFFDGRYVDVHIMSILKNEFVFNLDYPSNRLILDLNGKKS